MNQKKWSFWIDRGGTFTDIVAKKPNNEIVVKKFLSQNDKVYEDAASFGILNILNKNNLLNNNISSIIDEIKMGTTVATNALLERKGENTLLVITKGYRDALEIAYQDRSNIFAKKPIKPQNLYKNVLEVDERIDSDGNILKKLNLNKVKEDLIKFKSKGFKSLAIVLMHSYKFKKHEELIEKIALKIGFNQISISSKVSPLVKIVCRGDTTVADAYLSPVLNKYIQNFISNITNSSNNNNKIQKNIYFMMSSGGLTSAINFKGKDSILSGPAGGVVGSVETIKSLGIDKIINFDMGGTSTDVSHFNKDYERKNENIVAGTRITSPMLDIHTVAAGGGSILKFEDDRFQVGPQSAGSNPGPTCYDNNGPLTVTDANLIVGKISPKYFPKIFGKKQNKPLNKEKVIAKFKQLKNKNKINKNIEKIATGYLQIASENMANAIKKISIERGHDITKYALSCYGGASGQHACSVANSLGMKKIVFNKFSGVLSAYGMGISNIRSYRQKNVNEKLNLKNLNNLKRVFSILKQECFNELFKKTNKLKKVIVNYKLFLKYFNSTTTIEIPFNKLDIVKRNFNRNHKIRFGVLFDTSDIIIDFIETEVVIDNSSSEKIRKKSHFVCYPYNLETTKVFLNDKWVDVSVIKEEQFLSGTKIKGPLLIIENNQTIFVEDGWETKFLNNQFVVLDKINEKKLKNFNTLNLNKSDPILLEIFNNLFMNIAEQMGTVLQQTASSVNIKERVDFSCAVFSKKGELIANAPHMPVHLGSMQQSVQSIIKNNKNNIYEGDSFALNAPYNGGTHLPDITIVTPVFIEKKLTFFVASRGHHADVGGTAPGSMTPLAKNIEEEGVLFDNVKIISKKIFNEKLIFKIFKEHKYPARNVLHNILDIKAQIASNYKGLLLLQEAYQLYGKTKFLNYIKFISLNAEKSVANAIKKLKNSNFTLKTDNDAIIKVKITKIEKNKKVIVDFTGTSNQLPNNFNAPKPVVIAAVLYCFRLLVDKNIPMNSGCLKPIKIIIPKDCMLNPKYPAAVVAGNVETSQHLVNALLSALNVMSSSQGTMNNLTFGNQKYQYYETICSGSPAGPDFHGTNAIQVHMTNSRLTDPEILELKFPVILKNFHIRRNSGGKGIYNGGDGTYREILFKEDMELAILSSHRKIKPHGLKGGENGMLGENYIIRKNKNKEILNGCDYRKVNKGDAIVIKTPTPGGYGKRK
ncbi:hydantoinase B/oxoprolinase family protein [Alphaproteobacteria bacterium]|nr:hydantoinase B/oxoprolinase family protein [Alphaproteobacteria bacterium]